MKMTKKLLIGAVLAAAVLSISCQKEIGDIEWKNKGTGDGTRTYTVNQHNEADGTIRGMKQADSLSRAKATCVVQQFDQTKSSRDGVVGFATFVTENKDDPEAENYKTLNFLVVGVRNVKGKTQTYASYYCNIKKDELSTKNFGAKKSVSAYIENEKAPYEVVIEDLPELETKQNLNASVVDGVLKVAIDFESKTNGTIDIKWYKDFETNDAATTCTFTAAPIKELTANNTHLGTDGKQKNGKIYAYANIYADRTLKGQWDIYNVSSIQTAAFVDEDEDLPLFVGDIFFEEM